MDPIELMQLEEKKRAVEVDKERRKAREKLKVEVTKRLPVAAQKGSPLELVFYPDERLEKPCEPVEVKSSEIRKLGQNMLTTMYLCGGVGLAAPQVGRLERVFVLDWSGEKKHPLVVVNPDVMEVGIDEVSLIEGCLSFPAARFPVARVATVRAHWFNDVGKEYDQWLDGWAARIFLHEYDHLNGITFLDKTTPIVRRTAMKKLGKLQQRVDRDKKGGQRTFQRRNWR